MTLHLDDARWRAAVDAHLRGEASDSHDELLERYEPHGDEHRAEAAFLAALAEPPAPEDATPAWLTDAVDAYTDGARATPTRRRWPWLAAAAAVVLAVGAGASALRPWETPRRLHGARVSFIPQLQSPAPASVDPRWTIASGSARLRATLPLEQALTVETRLCAEQPGHQVCADEGARVTALGSGALALHEGRATVRSTDSDDVRLQLDEVVVHTRSHSVVVIERRTAGWSVTVESGGAVVTELGTSRRLTAGETLERAAKPEPAEPETEAPPSAAKKPRRAPKLEASALLGRARAQRRAGETQAAMKTYAALLRQHPRSPAAQTARMSLAQLHLERGAAKDALKLFRAYVDRGGPLAQDAAYGEIRALRALGRASESKRATEAFLRRYPQSPYGAKLKP